MTERLLHDDPPPAAGQVVVAHAGAFHLLEHHRERGRRDGQVERRVARDAVGVAQVVEGARELVEGGVVVERPGHELDVAGQPGPHLVAPGGAGVGLGRLPGHRLEVAVAPVAAGEAEHHEAGRQQAPVGQVVDGRQQLLAGQVTGDAEDDQRARLRDAGQPAVERVAQRVRPARTVIGLPLLPPGSVAAAARSWAVPVRAVGEVQPQQRSARARPGPAGRRRPGRPAARRRCTAGRARPGRP